MDIIKNVNNQELEQIVNENSKKIYKIYDNVREEEVFEGTFKEYKDYVISSWEETKRIFEEDEKFEEIEENYLTAIECVKESKSFIDLFNELEYHNINIFGDCVELEVK